MRAILLFMFLFLVGCGVQKMEVPATKEPVKKETITEPKKTEATKSSPAPVASAPKPAPMPPRRDFAKKDEGRDIDRRTQEAVAARTVREKISKNEPTKPAAYADITEQLYNASMAFDVANTTLMGERLKAQLLINPVKEVEELVNELKSKKARINESVEISRIVSATLTGNDFIITPVTPQKQAISKNRNTEWIWTLEPKTPGDHEISLDIAAVVRIDGESTEYHIVTFSRNVDVKVKPVDEVLKFIKSYWQWLFTVLLLPVGKYWLTRKKKKKKI